MSLFHIISKPENKANDNILKKFLNHTHMCTSPHILNKGEMAQPEIKTNIFPIKITHGNTIKFGNSEHNPSKEILYNSAKYIWLRKLYVDTQSL